MRVVSIVGARPQFVKLGPVSRVMAGADEKFNCEINETVLHTGQHYDEQMSDVFFRELSIQPPDINLEVGSGAHGAQTARMLEGIEAVLRDRPPDVVLVYGDTNSTLAGALAASKLNISSAHVEAGLRSFNRRMPEEVNRIVADHISDLLFAPTSLAMENLARENLSKRARLVGDVMLDATRLYGTSIRGPASLPETLGINEELFAIVTIHRPVNTEPGVLESLLQTLNSVAESRLPIVFPVHPRTRAVISESLGSWRPVSRLRMIDPLGYLDMMHLIAAASIVITDSGGLQKEAFFSGVRCVTLRDETEWRETVTLGGNTTVGSDRASIVSAIDDALSAARFQGSDEHRKGLEYYGNGMAAESIVEALINEYGDNGD